MNQTKTLFNFAKTLIIFGTILLTIMSTVILMSIGPIMPILALGALFISALVIFRIVDSEDKTMSPGTMIKTAVEVMKDSMFTIMMIVTTTVIGIVIYRLSGDFVSDTIGSFFDAILVTVCLLFFVMATAPSILEWSKPVQLVAGAAIVLLTPIGFVLFMASVSVQLTSDLVENMLGEDITHEVFGEYDEDGSEISPGFFRRKVREATVFLISEEAAKPRNHTTRPVQIPRLKEQSRDIVVEPSSPPPPVKPSARTEEILKELEELRSNDRVKDVHLTTTLHEPEERVETEEVESEHEDDHHMTRPDTEVEVDTGFPDLEDTGLDEKEEPKKKARRIRYIPIPIPIPIPLPPRPPRGSRR